MMKLLFVGRRAPGRTRAGAQSHLARVHGRMVVLPPADAGAMPARYTQHHVIDGAYPGSGRYAIERDLVTELWFDGIDHLKASTATDYYRTNLMPDEPSFVDGAGVEKLLATPTPLRAGAEGAFKLMLLLSRGGEAWDDGLAQTLQTLGEAGFGAMTANTTVPPPGAEPFVDTVIEAWHDDRDAVIAATDRFAALPIAGAIDMARSLAVAVEVFPTERLRALAA